MYILSTVFFALSWTTIRTHYLNTSNEVGLITALKPWRDMTSATLLTLNTLIADFTFVRWYLCERTTSLTVVMIDLEMLGGVGQVTPCRPTASGS